MSGWTPESLAAHKARLEIIEKLGWGPSSIAGPEWIVERVKREKRELEIQIETLKNDLAGVINTKNEIRKEAYERGLTVIELESKLGIANRLIDVCRAALLECREQFDAIRSDWSDPRSEIRAGQEAINKALGQVATSEKQENRKGYTDKRICEYEIAPAPVLCGLPLPCPKHTVKRL